MKKQLSILVFLGLVILIDSGLCFADDTVYQFRLPKDVEPIYGTWVNKGYTGNQNWEQKWVYYEWGYGESYAKISDQKPTGKCFYILVEKWKDADGNVWYREFDQIPNTSWRIYELNRISADGTVLEVMQDLSGFPKKMDSKSSAYRIFHLLEE